MASWKPLWLSTIPCRATFVQWGLRGEPPRSHNLCHHRCFGRSARNDHEEENHGKWWVNYGENHGKNQDENGWPIDGMKTGPEKMPLIRKENCENHLPNGFQGSTRSIFSCQRFWAPKAICQKLFSTQQSLSQILTYHICSPSQSPKEHKHSYPLVNKHSYWTWPIYSWFTQLLNGDSPIFMLPSGKLTLGNHHLLWVNQRTKCELTF